MIASAAIGGGASLIGGGVGASSSKSAAKTQADATRYATDVQNAQFNKTQANLQPYLDSGYQSLADIVKGLQPGGEFATPYSQTFTPPDAFKAPAPYTLPTAAEAEATPGYQVARNQGDLGILTGATAAGGAFNSGTLKSLAKYNQDLASGTYQQTVGNTQGAYQQNYSNLFNTYQQNYQNALQNFQTGYNTYNTNQSNLYNRLAGVAGVGQTTANTLGTLGQQNATSIGTLAQNAASANAAGTIGAANAYNSALGGVANSVTGQLSLSQLLRNLNPLPPAASPSSMGAQSGFNAAAENYTPIDYSSGL